MPCARWRARARASAAPSASRRGEGTRTGLLRFLYDLDYDPTDTGNPTGVYTAYDFIPAGKTGIPNMSLTRDWGRRESVASIPGMDSVLDGYGRRAGPMDRRDVTFAFRVIVGPSGNIDAAEDLLRAQVAPGKPQRLVYQTDSGVLWYTVGYNPSIRQTTVADNKALTAHVDFAVTWRIRPWWTPRNPEPQPVLYDAANDEVYRADNSEVYATTGSVAIASASQALTLDATGTAGSNLPTIPDTGPFVFISGPAGGDSGLAIQNLSVVVRDANGTQQYLTVTLPFKLATANDSYSLNFATQSFLHNGVPFRPVKASYQPVYCAVRNGVVNQWRVNALGANAVVGGACSVLWWRKRA